MSRILFRVGFLAAVAMLPASAEVNRSWETLVETVQVGKNVVVKKMNSVQVEGKLLDISADTITVRWKGKPEVIVREDVLRVRYANIRRRNTLLGMVAGSVVGAIMGAAGSKYNRGSNALGGVIFCVGPGAAVGGAWPIGAPLYEAPGGVRRR